ncbi:MAG: DNA ligase D [Vicinamibacterales bacterium]
MFDVRALRPMLAVLPAHEPPLGDARLVYEPKYDGIRAIALVDPASGPPRARLWSRNGREKTDQFPEVTAALEAWAQALGAPHVFDGELVALDPAGRPAGFQRLQGRINVRAPGYTSRAEPRTPAEQPAAFIAFDVLREGAHDLRGKPLTERRKRLEAIFADHPPASDTVRLTPQAAGDGHALMAQATDEGWEGLIVKVARSPYRAGRRSPEWQKLKLQLQDEFIVGGWTEPKGARARFGALILGVRDGRTLRYVGDVGTGFNGAELDRLWALLQERATSRSPFTPPPKTAAAAHWVTPSLVVQVRYTEMTDEGRLRHPAYLGLRDDKAASEVHAPGRTTSASRPAAAKRRTVTAKTSASRKASRGAGRKRVTDPLAAWDAEAAMLTAQIDDLEARKKDGRLRLPDGDTLDVTNPSKVFWPEPGLTKGDLLRYYARVAPLILPVIADRPLVMKRLPNGITRQAFYQHRAPDPVPSGVRIETLPDDDVPARLVGGSLKTLLYMAQLASISMDPFFSRVDTLDLADQVAIDLDPQEGATFTDVLHVARWVHEELERLDVPAFPKTSGSSGVHIFIPLPPGTPYQAGMLFCQIVATLVATRHPKVATVERMVGKRKRGTIYVDYLQNIEGKTLACAYSARASAFAGVSAPLTWDEIHGTIHPEDFTLGTMIDRVRAVGDLWAPLRRHEGADLAGALDRLRGGTE